MKRAFPRNSLIIAMALVVTVSFAYAGGAKESSPGSGASGTSVSKPVTLKFFTYEEVMRSKFDAINALYEKSHPNVKIEMVYVPSADVNTKVDTTILSGSQLDITYFNEKFDFLPRAAKGEFVALNKYIAAEGKSFNDLYTIDASYNGQVYGLPGEVKLFLIWINKNDLEKVGLPQPPLNWTWQDYRDYAKKLTWGSGPDKHYGSFGYVWDHYNVLETYGIIKDNPYFKADGSLNFENPAFKQSLQLRIDLEQVDKSQMPLSDVQSLNMNYLNAFLGGKASMLWMATNIVPQIASIDQYPHTFVTTFAPMPVPPNGGHDGWTYGDNRFYSVGKTTVDAQAAYDYIRFFTTKGILMKGIGFSAAQGAGSASNNQVVDALVANHPELYDIPALKSVINNPKLFVNVWTNVPISTAEIDQMYQKQAELAVTGDQTPDQAIANAMKQGQAILARYNK
jgi:multiple sugar transport system substrate-binding protein